MRNFLLVFVIILFSISTNAQVYVGSKASSLVSGTDKLRFKEFTDVPNYISFRNDELITFDKAIAFTLDFVEIEDAGLAIINKNTDKLGYTHTRLNQTINGISVEYASWLIREQDGYVRSMNGNILSNSEISGSFLISSDDALQFALNYVNADLYIFEADETSNPYKENYSIPVPEKVFLPENGKLESAKLTPAYKIDVFALMPYSRQYVYVSAVDGSILHTETRIYSADTQGTAVTGYSGTQTITTDSYNGYYRLRESGRGNGIATYNCNNTAEYDDATDFTDDDNYWDNANDQLDQYATDAHFATEKTYDYFLNFHNRNSIDNNGHELNSYVHFSLIDYGYGSNVNAFWNGSVMTYGDGSDNVSPLTTVDICAHEITHGLTSYTSNLTYQDESGALNEAFSDIFAVAVEHYAVPEFADWLIGEDIGYAFRSVSNPKSYGLPDTYHGENWYFESGDNGGVHTNNGPLCYWFYLISEGGSGTNDYGDSYSITGLGMEAAAEIAFRLQTVYLTNSSQYLDARFYGIQAAIDFYGPCSPEVEQVTNAFYAIGVGGAYVNEVVADFSANYTENCVPPFTVKFYNYSINGSDFVWDFGDGSTSTAVNPQHTFTTLGEFDVQLYADGGTCGDDTELKEGFISINFDNPCMAFMPSSGNITTDRCQGTLYDIGGPDEPYYNNLNSTYTIQPEGATQIVLNITQFDIEPGSGTSCDYDYIAFYDGPTTSAPLINDTYYCNTTGNPGTIVSTGNAITIRFYSDAGLSLDGFEIEWQCLLNTNPPIALFAADVSYTCSGVVQFNDLSMNNPEEYLWNFGDGNTSTEANPVHVYTQSGTYNVSLIVSNENGSAEYELDTQIVVAMDEAIDVEDLTVCIDSLFDLTINGFGENLNWYSDELCSTLVHSGSLWNHDALQSDAQYYIRQFFDPITENVGPTNNTAGGGFFGNPDYIHYLIFDAYQPFELVSVSVNAESGGMRNIALRDQNSNIIDVVQVYCNQGVSRIDLNLNVPVGNNLQLVGLGSPNLFRTNNDYYLGYPFTVEDVVSITSSSASNDPTGYYYYFYDWEIELPGCQTEPAVLNINAIDCSVNVNEELANNLRIYPNPVEDIVFISGLNNQNESIYIDLIDISGRKLITKIATEDTTISTENLPSGVYFINISGGKLSGSYKIVKY
jgi:Zn-dependent metalloprotease